MTTGQFLKEEVKGVADTTIAPVINAVTHPLDTIHQAFEGFGLLTKPSALREAGSEAVTEMKQGVSNVLDGNPRAIGQAAGLVISTFVAVRGVQGSEIKVNNNLRIAPAGNRTGNPLGELPHYHRRGIGPSGDTVPGQGIGRHRPWQSSPVDGSFWDRF